MVLPKHKAILCSRVKSTLTRTSLSSSFVPSTKRLRAWLSMGSPSWDSNLKSAVQGTISPSLLHMRPMSVFQVQSCDRCYSELQCRTSSWTVQTRSSSAAFQLISTTTRWVTFFCPWTATRVALAGRPSPTGGHPCFLGDGKSLYSQIRRIFRCFSDFQPRVLFSFQPFS